MVASVNTNADWIPSQPYTPASVVDSIQSEVIPVDNTCSAVFTHTRDDVSRIMLHIYMMVLSLNGSATIGMYAIRSQNTAAKE